MNFIEPKDGVLIKYLVQLNETALADLRSKIILHCGEITHYCYESETDPDFTKHYFVKNFKQSFVREYEYDYFYTWGKKQIFCYEYDVYAPTPLTMLIDRLFEGDSSAILELRDPQKEESIQDKLYVQLQEKKDQIISLLGDTTIVDVNRLDQLKNELNFLQEKQKLNCNRSCDLQFYSQVLLCIQLIEITRIPEDHIIRVHSLLEKAHQSITEVQSFFEDSEEKKTGISISQKIIGTRAE